MSHLAGLNFRVSGAPLSGVAPLDAQDNAVQEDQGIGDQPIYGQCKRKQVDRSIAVLAERVVCSGRAVEAPPVVWKYQNTAHNVTDGGDEAQHCRHHFTRGQPVGRESPSHSIQRPMALSGSSRRPRTPRTIIQIDM